MVVIGPGVVVLAAEAATAARCSNASAVRRTHAGARVMALQLECCASNLRCACGLREGHLHFPPVLVPVFCTRFMMNQKVRKATLRARKALRVQLVSRPSFFAFSQT